MKAKHIIYPLLSIVFIAAAMSCSNIDEDERLIYVPPAEVAKHVLIEDFTGQACVNCPAAASLISDLQEQYGEENVIAVGIYSGAFGMNISGKFYPLTTETGNYYYNLNGVSEQPTAMIDRHGINSITATWATEVYNCIQDSAKVELDITNNYDETTRTVSITVTALAVKDFSGKLQVWLTEDNIISWQYQSDGSVDDNYVHNHVFRDTVNDRDGETFAVSEGYAETRTFTYTLSEEWTAENVAVVAFVTDGDGVVQVTKAPVIPAADLGGEPDETEEINNE